MEIVFSQEAENDVVEIAAYIAQDNAVVAAQIFDSVWETCGLIASLPEMGTLIDSLYDTRDLGEEVLELLNAQPLLTDIRRFPVKKFNRLLIFYKVKSDQLHIERILHGRRDIPTIFLGMITDL